MQILEGLLRKGGLPAHDPDELSVQHAEVSAAVNQRVVVVVGGQHPVGGRWRVWKWWDSRVISVSNLYKLAELKKKDIC